MFIFGGLKAQVTLSGAIQVGLAQPAATQTVKHGTADLNINTTYLDVYTVTGGKTFYLTSVVIANAGTIPNQKFTISDNGGSALHSLAGTDAAPNQATAEFITPIPISTKLQIKCNTLSNNCTVSYHGFEA